MDSANTSEPETNDTNTANTDKNSVGSQVEVPDNPVFSAPLKRNEKGQFVAGTGSRGYLGGRPKGAKDKLSVQFLDVMQAVIEEKGTEMMTRLAEENPAAALAIISRSLPQKAMQDAIDGVTDEGEKAIDQITINLVSSPSPRLSDSRSEEAVQARQRGLESPVERLPEPSESDLRDVIEAGVAAPTQHDMDEEAARAERERQERQRDAIKAHGGLTGRRARSSAPDTLDYPDDGGVI